MSRWPCHWRAQNFEGWPSNHRDTAPFHSYHYWFLALGPWIKRKTFLPFYPPSAPKVFPIGIFYPCCLSYIFIFLEILFWRNIVPSPPGCISIFIKAFGCAFFFNLLDWYQYRWIDIYPDIYLDRTAFANPIHLMGSLCFKSLFPASSKTKPRSTPLALP